MVECRKSLTNQINDDVTAQHRTFYHFNKVEAQHTYISIQIQQICRFVEQFYLQRNLAETAAYCTGTCLIQEKSNVRLLSEATTHHAQNLQTQRFILRLCVSNVDINHNLQ